MCVCAKVYLSVDANTYYMYTICIVVSLIYLIYADPASVCLCISVSNLPAGGSNEKIRKTHWVTRATRLKSEHYKV